MRRKLLLLFLSTATVLLAADSFSEAAAKARCTRRARATIFPARTKQTYPNAVGLETNIKRLTELGLEVIVTEVGGASRWTPPATRAQATSPSSHNSTGAWSPHV